MPELKLFVTFNVFFLYSLILSLLKTQKTVRDFLVSDESPMIPPIIYHTVQEIERRGLDEAGLYRVPGMLRVVKELREKFKGKVVPKLMEVFFFLLSIFRYFILIVCEIYTLRFYT